MTEYFTEMTDICTKWGGTLDQFIGDAIVIFFGAPKSKGVEEDARRALAMALDMQQRLDELRANGSRRYNHGLLMSEWALALAIVMLAILDLMIVYITPPLAQLLTVQRASNH